MRDEGGAGTHNGRAYAALRDGAVSAVLRRSILRITGSDTFDFLHRMSTNDVRSLSDGEQRRTVIVNEKGRVLDIVTLARRGDQAVVVGSPGAGESVAKWLEKFIIMDDVRISEATNDTLVQAVYGPEAGAIVGRLTPGEPAGAPPHGAGPGGAVEEADIVKEDLGRIPGYLIIPRGGEPPPDTQAAPRERGAAAPPPLPGIPALDDATLETARIEECVPAMGHELGPDVNALEAGLKPYISFTKGCYIGQEVIARIDTYRKLQNILSLFIIPDFEGRDLQPGPLRLGNTDAGRITSTARSPRHSAWIGLGYRRVRIHAGGIDMYPGGGSTPIPCSIVRGNMPGYEEYETEE